MKHFFTFILCVVISLSVSAQPENLYSIEDIRFGKIFETSAIPQVTGQLQHVTAGELENMTISYTLVTIYGQVSKVTRPSSDGSFSLQLEYPFPYQQIWLSIGDIFYAGIYANKKLHIILDVEKIKSTGGELDFNGEGVSYLGADGPINVYMNDYILYRRQEQLALSNRVHQIARHSPPVAKKVLADYTGIFDSVKTIQDDYIATHPSPYAWLLENERLSELYAQIFVAYWGYKMEDSLFTRLSQHQIYLVSNSSAIYYRYLATYLHSLPGNRIIVPEKNPVTPADMQVLSEKERDSVLAIYTPQGTQERKKAARKRVTQNEIHFLDSVFTPCKADFVKLQLIDSKDIAEQQAKLEQILPGMHTNWWRTIAEATYKQTVEKIAAINRALADTGSTITAAGFKSPLLRTGFGATLYNIFDMKATDFLTALRQSFPGKAIVLDRWATWCAPCLSEMPHSKKLQQQTTDLPVVFVYVCTVSGSDEDTWKRKVGELELPGIHFFIDQALDAELSQYFSFTGYPGYAFIDQKGTYQPGAIKWMSDIKDRAALADLLK